MKKVVCLLMVVMLMLALSVTSFGRGEPCEEPGCDGYVTYSYYNARIPARPCPATGGTHTVIERHQVYGCDTCGNVLWDDVISTTYSCGQCG